MSADTRYRSRRPAFTNRDFTLYWCARILGRLAVELQITGVGWQVYKLTQDPFDLGLVGLAQFAPFLLLFLLAGAAADTFPRTKLLGGCIVLEAGCSLLLFGLTLTSIVTFPRIFVVLVVLGMARAFQSPVQQAIVPVLVPRQHFANAIAWTATGTQLARISGPALAGGLLILGQTYVYATALGCFTIAAVLTFLIRADTQIISRERPSWSTILAGFTFIWSRQIMLGVIALDLFAVLLGGATALLPIYALDILRVGAVGFGSLRAAHMAGAFLCALALTQRQITRHTGAILLSSVSIFGAAIVVFGLSRTFWLSIVALFTMGAADAISVFIRSFVVQMRTPNDMRGRVSAINAVFIGASNELGEFESGITAAWWGVVPAVVVGGLGTIGVTALFTWFLPQLRALDRLDQDEMAQTSP